MRKELFSFTKHSRDYPTVRRSGPLCTGLTITFLGAGKNLCIVRNKPPTKKKNISQPIASLENIWSSIDLISEGRYLH